MNNKLLFPLVGALLIGLIGGYAITRDRGPEYDDQRAVGMYGNGNGNYGGGMMQGEPNRANCVSDDCLLVSGLEYPAGDLSPDAKDALQMALDDEYKAYATYEAVIAKFGSTRPFSMIIRAEELHISSLKALFDKYGLTVPVNPYTGKVTAPASLTASCQTGVDAEISNADLYKSELLPKVTEYEDIALVFNNLMSASENKHLPAFEKCN